MAAQHRAVFGGGIFCPLAPLSLVVYMTNTTDLVRRTLAPRCRVFLNPVSTAINETLDQPDPDFSQIAEFATGQKTKAMWQENGTFLWRCVARRGCSEYTRTTLNRMVKKGAP